MSSWSYIFFGYTWPHLLLTVLGQFSDKKTILTKYDRSTLKYKLDIPTCSAISEFVNYCRGHNLFMLTQCKFNKNAYFTFSWDLPSLFCFPFKGEVADKVVFGLLNTLWKCIQIHFHQLNSSSVLRNVAQTSGSSFLYLAAFHTISLAGCFFWSHSVPFSALVNWCIRIGYLNLSNPFLVHWILFFVLLNLVSRTRFFVIYLVPGIKVRKNSLRRPSCWNNHHHRFCLSLEKAHIISCYFKAQKSIFLIFRNFFFTPKKT